MSMNYNDPTRPTTSVTEDEGLLIAPVPAWERSKKRRGMLGGLKTPTRTAEARTFDTTTDTTAATTYRDDRVAPPAAATAGIGAMDTRTAYGTTATDATADDGLIAAPIARTSTTTTRKSKGGVPGAAVALGIVALAGVGAAGWYMSQDNDGVAELTPGVTTDTSQTALATAPMAPAPAPVAESRPIEMAQAEPAPTTVRSTATTTRRTTATRTTRSTAPSATEQGINASGTATLPDGPQPYSPGSSTTSTTITTTAPVTVAPPVTEPAPIPSTPPTAAEPVNPVTPETAPTTQAPDPTTTPQ